MERGEWSGIEMGERWGMRMGERSGMRMGTMRELGGGVKSVVRGEILDAQVVQAWGGDVWENEKRVS